MISFSRAIAAALTLCAASALAELPIEAREQLNTVLWLQTATEYRAAALQTYRAAALGLMTLKSTAATASVEQARAGDFAHKLPVVVLDIDETVLDNSPYNAALVRSGQAFDPAGWERWSWRDRRSRFPVRRSSCSSRGVSDFG